MVRRAESYARREPRRAAYDSVLIVCEGGKTEPNYLERLRIVHRLSNANIRITPADGTDPMSIVAFAERELSRNDYDRVYCVFDRDEHNNYFDALRRISALPKFFATTSWPCFEIWILLHFKYSTAPQNRHEALAELRKHYPAYSKGCKTVFDDMTPALERAVQHAERLQGENERNGSVNPATRMHELVTYLMGLKE
jgi:hypothetical protein